jgi:exoribonuclease II
MIYNVQTEYKIYQLSIYISNVTIWMDILNLWNSFSQRISTIYLPDKKRPMLPTILSECLCSLQENLTRIAFVMDIFIQNIDKRMRNISH